jgi:hypothetical protein
MNPSRKVVPLPSDEEEPIAPVTIFDAQGQVVRIVCAEEFRRRRLAEDAEIRNGGRSLVSTPVRRAPRRAPARVPHRSLAS